MSDAKAIDRAAVHFPPPLVFLASLAIGYAIDRWLWPLAMAPVLASWLLIGLGALLLVAGLAMIVMSFVLFKKTGQEPEPWTTTPEIITAGIYRYSRNPMYVGMTLIQLGIGLTMGILWIIALAPVSLGIVYLIAVRHEEAYLLEKFGPPFETYMRSVRRWL